MSPDIKFKKNALFIFEVGEENMWIGAVKEWIEHFSPDPFSVVVHAVTNRDFRDSDLQGKDIIFLANIIMPDPDGFSVLSHLQRLGVTIPIVVASAMMSDSFYRQLSLRGISFKEQVRFLSKPFSLHDLSGIFLDLLSS